MGRRNFTAEFKREAVRLVIERGMPVTRAAKQLEVHPNVLGKWVKDFKADPAQAFPGQGRMKPEQAEIERLRKEVNRLKAERDILKKATAYFAKESS
jgi:transposase